MNFAKNTVHIGMVCLALASGAAHAAPSKQQIVGWLTNKNDIVAENVRPDSVFINKTVPIRLASGEEAYLTAVEYGDAGRNFTHGYILTRPKLQKSLHLKEFAGQTAQIKILSQSRKATLLQLASSGSGQGTMSSGQSVVSFNGWAPTVHYESKSYSDGGAASDGEACTSIESVLSFQDGNPAQVTDKVTTVRQSRCDNPKTAQRSTKTYNKIIRW